MANVKDSDGTTLLRVGLVTLAIFVVLVLLAWALGLEAPRSQLELAAETGDPAQSFSALVSGGVQDTARVVQLGQLTSKVDESSGVAVSRRFPDVLWTHNDQGGDPRLHAVRKDGTLIASVLVTGAEAEDWEDIDLAPCPEGGPRGQDCLFVGDIGDNGHDRDSYSIYVVPEPDPNTTDRVSSIRRVRFRYPDGSADTEALAMTPGGDALVITKGHDGAARLYRVPMVPDTAGPGDSVRNAVLVGALPLDVGATRDRVTGAALSPDGTRLAVRNHHAVYLFSMERPLGAPILCEIGVRQPQGEGLDFLSEDMLVLTSEERDDRAPIIRLRCP